MSSAVRCSVCCSVGRFRDSVYQWNVCRDAHLVSLCSFTAQAESGEGERINNYRDYYKFLTVYSLGQQMKQVPSILGGHNGVQVRIGTRIQRVEEDQ